MRKRFGSRVLAVGMACSLTLSSVVCVGAENTADETVSNVQEQTIQFGTSGIAAPSFKEKAWSGDYIYFGDDETGPMKWRVLDTTGSAGSSSVTGGVLLQADHVLDERMAFEDEKDSKDEHKRSSDEPINWNDWGTSDIRTWLQGSGETQFLSSSRVTDLERDAIMKTTAKAGTSAISGLNATPLNDDTVFLLDGSDLANEKYGYCYEDGGDGTVGKHWWLRSAGAYGEQLAGYNLINGYLFHNIVSDTNGGVVPAFNLEQDKVLFSSSADMDKTADFSEVNAKDVTEWKLTLLDEDKKLSVPQDEVKRKYEEVTIPYAYEGSDSNQLSLMITEGDCEESDSVIVYYGKVAGEVKKSGTVTFSLPEDYDEETMQVYLLAEQVAGGKETDSASKPVEVTIPPLHEHQWSEQWASDEDCHWKNCINSETECDLLEDEDKEGYGEHEFDEGEELKAATCLEPGQVKYTCETCGYSYIEEEEGEHEFPEEGEIIVAPTCEEDGLKRFTCIYCGEIEEEEIEAEGHDFDETEVLKEVTCTENGLERSTCRVCGYVEEEEVEAEGHEFLDPEVIKEPTFWEAGIERSVCEVCGAYEDEEIPPLCEEHVHSYTGKQEIVNPATCENPGLVKIYCEDEDCGESQMEVIPATGHSYGEWKVTKAAGFSVDGEQTKTCKNCGKEEKQEIPRRAQNHTHKYTGTEEIIKAPTCTEEGIKRIHCYEAECESYVDEVVAKTEHNTSGAWWVDENQHWKVCDCYEKFKIANHTWTTGEITTNPTSKAEGVITYECSECGYKVTKPVAKLGTKFTLGDYRYKVVQISSGEIGLSMIGLKKNNQLKTIKIPDTADYNGVTYKVLSVGKKAFCKNEKIKKVIVGNNVKEIEKFAFFRADKVQRITIGDNVTKIGEHNFCHLVNLKKLTIQSKNLKKVNGVVFHGNEKVKISVPKSRLKKYKKLFLPGKSKITYKINE